MPIRFRSPQPDPDGEPAVIDLRSATPALAEVAVLAFDPQLRGVIFASDAAAAVLNLDASPSELSTFELGQLLDRDVMVSVVLALALGRPATYHYDVVAPGRAAIPTVGRIVVPTTGDRPLIVATWPHAAYVTDRIPMIPPGLDDALSAAVEGLPDVPFVETLLYVGIEVLRAESGALLVPAGTGSYRIHSSVNIEGAMPFATDRDHPAATVERFFAGGTTIDLDGAQLRFSAGLAGPANRQWLRDIAERVYAHRSRAPINPPSETVPDRRPVVVYVDDDPESVNLLSEYFRLLSSYELLTASTAAQALDLIDRVNPEVVLLDAWLGDAPVETLLAPLWESASTSNRAVVMLSADASRATIEHYRSLGAVAYLPKPLDLVELSRVIDRLFAQSDPAESKGGTERVGDATTLAL